MSAPPYVVLACGTRVAVTRHAVERYHERVRPGLASYEAAFGELLCVLRACGVVHTERPGWAHPSPDDGDGSRWVLLGDDVALVGQMNGRRLVATSLLLRGGMSDARRERQQARRRERAAARRGRRHGLKKGLGRDTRPRPREESAGWD